MYMKFIPLFMIIMCVEAYSENIIDSALIKCKSENQSTNEMVLCIDNATLEWDAELNRNYKALMKNLNGSEQKTLKNAQIKWIDYKNAELEVIQVLRSHTQGTIARLYAADRIMEITKNRAMELENYMKYWIED